MELGSEIVAIRVTEQVARDQFDYPTALFREMEMTWWLEQAVVLDEVAE